MRLAGDVQGAKAVGFLAIRMKALLAGQLQPELALDVLEACRVCKETDIKSKLATYESKLPGDDSLAKFRPALYGGNSVAGREVFRTHANAQCVRCHEAGGEGYQAGPVLAGIATRATLNICSNR